MEYNIIENEPNPDGSEDRPTFEVYLGDSVVFYAPTKEECESWISLNPIT